MMRGAVLLMMASCAVGFAQPAAPNSTNISVLRFQRFVTTVYGYQAAEFNLTNTVAQAVWFTGYSLHSPLYSIEQKHGSRWVPLRMGWCGTGLDRQKLDGYGSVSFRIAVPNVSTKPVRIGVSYSTEKDWRKEDSKTTWSEIIQTLKPLKSRKRGTNENGLSFNDQPLEVWLTKIGGGSQDHYDAAEAFRHFGTAAVSPLLQRFNDEHTPDATRVKILQALAEIGPGATNARSLLIKVSSQVDNEQLQYSAIRALGFVAADDLEACNAVMKQLDAPDQTLRYQAVQTLWQFGVLAEPAVPKLIALGAYPDSMLLARVVMTLPAIGPAAQPAVELLKHLLTTNSHFGVSSYAAAALWSIAGSDEGLPTLLKSLQDLGPSAGFAAKCIGEFGVAGQAAKPDLLWLIERGDSMTRISAASSLYAVTGEIDIAVPVLIRELRSRDDFVPGHAASELAKVGAKALSAVSVLKELLEHRNAYVRQQAQIALRSITGG